MKHCNSIFIKNKKEEVATRTVVLVSSLGATAHLHKVENLRKEQNSFVFPKHLRKKVYRIRSK